MKKEDLIQEREALIEMYKAGFLDGYSHGNKLRTDLDWKNLNKLYRKSFMERFEKKITKTLKNMGRK